MLKFKETVKTEEVPKELWASIFDVEGIRDVEPIPCKVQFISFVDGFRVFPGGEKTEGVLTSSVWFEGCSSYHAEPPFLEAGSKIEEKYSDTLDIFYRLNNNNGRYIQYRFNSPEQEQYRDLFTYVAIPIAPCYSTWEPEKMLLLKIYKSQEKTINRVLYLIGKWKEKGRRFFPSVGEFISFMDNVDQAGGNSYISCLRFLEKVGYEELK